MINVNTIATDGDLALEFGGVEELNSTQPLAVRDACRESALRDALRALASRTPPVLEHMLLDQTELQMPVVYRALHKICIKNLNEGQDRYHILAKHYAEEWKAAIASTFTVSSEPDNASVSGHSFSLERR